MNLLFGLYFLIAMVSFYAVSRLSYPKILNVLHFFFLLAAFFVLQDITGVDFVKRMFLATGKTVEDAYGFGIGAYLASFAGGILAFIFQGFFHLIFGYLIGACLGIIRLGLFGHPKTRWI